MTASPFVLVFNQLGRFSSDILSSIYLEGNKYLISFSIYTFYVHIRKYYESRHIQ